MGGPYRYIPTPDEFQKNELRRAKMTLRWLKKFKIETPIMEWSERTPFTEMLEKEYGKIENLTIEEPDDDYQYPKGHSYQTIFCFDVLEHMMNPYFVVKRLHGALATGGHLFLTVPAALPFTCLMERHNFLEWRKEEIENVLLRARYKMDIETRCGTAMLPYCGLKPLLRRYLRRTHFVHATPDWSKKEHWWD